MNLLTHFLTKIKNVPQLLSEVRYGNCSAQANSGNRQHFAGIAPSTAVEIVMDFGLREVALFNVATSHD